MSSIRDSASGPDKKPTEITDLRTEEEGVQADDSVKGGSIVPCTNPIRPVQRDIVPCILPGKTIR